VRRRSTAQPPRDSAAGVLLACEREAEAAGDAQRLVQVRSWIHMLRVAGGDPQVGELLVAFAREDGHGVA
jgi:hypothetical protein